MLTLKCLTALRWAGLALWGAVLMWLIRGDDMPVAAPAGLAYLLWFWHATDIARPGPERARWTLGLSVLALALYGLKAEEPLADALVVAVAGVLPMQFGLRRTLAWVAAQSLGLWGVLSMSLGAQGALRDSLWSLGLQVALAVIMVLAFRHLQVRREWSALAAHTSQQAQEAERVRIARDLHDLLGHDLTLLGVELEHARHSGDPGAVRRARAIAARLGEDVRGTVSTLRPGASTWAEMLGPLNVSVPGLRVHVALPPTTPAPEPAALGALKMVVREALTNTVRHAGAANFYLEVHHDTQAVVVHMRDDGHPRAPLVPGHGLTGMHERLRAVGGDLQVHARPAGGVSVQARVPLLRATA